MRFLTHFAVTAALAGAAFFAPQADAAITISIAAAGSSAVFNAIGDDAVSTPGAHCGANHWSKKNGGAMHDNRTGLKGTTIADEVANVWVTWDGGTDGTGSTVACIYVAVDSGIGVRGFMANPRADVFVLGGFSGTAGDGLIGSLAADSALPAVIFNAINGGATAPFAGTTMNIAFSDVRPEDAQYATARALSVLPSNPVARSGLGYGDWPNPTTFGSTLVGTSIQSSYGTQLSTPVAFEIAALGLDPISNLAPSRWQTFPVGGVPVLILVSNADNSVTGLGNGLTPSETSATGPWTAGPYLANNVGRFNAAYVFDGSLTRTTDILSNGGAVASNCSNGPGASGANNCGLTVITREPLSGTYNTFEFTVPRTHDVQLSQEDFVNPAIAADNALNIVSASGGVRLRAIGTGQMVNAICGNLAPCSQPPRAGFVPTANRIGYAFWGYGNLKNLRGTHGSGTGTSYTTAPPLGHYLLVDGVDPLFTNASDNPDGALNPPICLTVPCSTVIPFTHLIDGSYSSWTIVRAIAPNSVSKGDGSSTDNLLAGLPASATKFYDFVPAANMLAFRAHRDASVAGINARNGNGCGIDYGVELGQDAGGAIFNIQNDIDYAFDNNGGVTSTCLGFAPADAGLTNIVQ